MLPVFNVRCRKVGGIWFLRLGRFQFSFCLCRVRDIREAQRVDVTAEINARRRAAIWATR